MWIKVFHFAWLAIFLQSCILNSSKINETSFSSTNDLSKNNTPMDQYWFDGKAELNSFQLLQARYGEIRRGEAMMIFVSEDFSRKKQVKLDQSSDNNKDQIKILKLNMTKRFHTGIYPYSLMLSVFSPINHAESLYPLKIAGTVSEWCGQIFTQFNQKSDHYLIRSFSYFESEADQEIKQPVIWTEDGIWNLIRIHPDGLPLGEIKMIPGVFYTRLKHHKSEAVTALCSLQKNDIGVGIYTIKFPDFKRTLEIQFTNSAPYPIIGWKESYLDGKEELTTTAVLKQRTKKDYWNLNQNKDSVFRKELRLEY
ncbi:MAG: hypothetical protein IPM48_08725 [Saprospiraceae bacterium]|nr:hypothetical protein [Saprospiraceae bacterium]